MVHVLLVAFVAASFLLTHGFRMVSDQEVSIDATHMARQTHSHNRGHRDHDSRYYTYHYYNDNSEDSQCYEDQKIFEATEFTMGVRARLESTRGWQAIRNEDNFNRDGMVHWQFKEDKLSFIVKGNSPIEQLFDYTFDRWQTYEINVAYSAQQKSVTLHIDGKKKQELLYNTAIKATFSRGHIGCWYALGALTRRVHGDLDGVYIKQGNDEPTPNPIPTPTPTPDRYVDYYSSYYYTTPAPEGPCGRLRPIDDWECPKSSELPKLPMCDVASIGQLCEADRHCGGDLNDVNNCGGYDIHEKLG